MKTQEKVRTNKYLRSARGIKVGDRFIYVSNGIELDGEIISKGAEYDAEVIDVTTHLIVLRMTADQSTIRRPYIHEAKPYNWAIRKVDVGISEKLYLT